MPTISHQHTPHKHTAQPRTAQYLVWGHTRPATVQPSHHLLVFLDLPGSEHFASLRASIRWSHQHQHSVLHLAASACSLLCRATFLQHSNSAHLHYYKAVASTHRPAAADRRRCVGQSLRIHIRGVLVHVVLRLDTHLVCRGKPRQHQPLTTQQHSHTVSNAHRCLRCCLAPLS